MAERNMKKTIEIKGAKEHKLRMDKGRENSQSVEGGAGDQQGKVSENPAKQADIQNRDSSEALSGEESVVNENSVHIKNEVLQDEENVVTVNSNEILSE